MAARLTVVLDDDVLYRQLKVKAAQDGIPMKDLVEAGLRLVLAGVPPAKSAEPGTAFDWERYESMMRDWDEEEGRMGEDDTPPSDLSDVKHYLYGRAPRIPVTRVAEERAEYRSE